jgi:UDP-N-acetylmuramoylalanine-D-glutamate ligase
MTELIKSQISNVGTVWLKPDEYAKSQISKLEVHEAGTLGNAVRVAAQVARAGDVVLLAPGGTSFDAFKDFAERGDKFAEYVNALE